ncbi:DNA methyltransferase [Parafrankia sp. Ea1.12]|uniref:DNA methyltransferase n=1 Tax=unclassified Parafrankia TaxID=2994368 RepID=UPI000DA54D76
MIGVRRAELRRNTILIGDVRTRLADLPPASIDAVITSPPYYGLRDYGVPGQLGLEGDVQGWVAGLRVVMASVARVLKPTGVV